MNIAASDNADTGNADGLTNLGMAKQNLLVGGSKHTLHSRLDLIEYLVDNTVSTDVYLVTLGRVKGILIGTDVEAGDDGIGCGCQHNVALGNAAYCGVDYVDLDLLVGELEKGCLQCLGRACNVGLNDDVKHLRALSDLAEQIV